MKLILYMSECIIPILIMYIVLHGIVSKCKVYDCFIEGAKEGLKTVFSIAPTLVGLMMAVGILRSSGLLETFAGLVAKSGAVAGFPSQLIPLVFIRLFSSSAATGLAIDIFKTYGTDSYIGLITSIMMSCTETVFYTMSVYFMAAKIKKTRWTLAGALFSTAAGVIASVMIANLMS